MYCCSFAHFISNFAGVVDYLTISPPRLDHLPRNFVRQLDTCCARCASQQIVRCWATGRQAQFRGQRYFICFPWRKSAELRVNSSSSGSAHGHRTQHQILSMGILVLWPFPFVRETRFEATCSDLPQFCDKLFLPRATMMQVLCAPL